MKRIEMKSFIRGLCRTKGTNELLKGTKNMDHFWLGLVAGPVGCNGMFFAH